MKREWQPLDSANAVTKILSVTIDSYWSIDMSWQIRVFCRKFLNHISIDTDQLDALTSASVSSDHAEVDIRML